MFVGGGGEIEEDMDVHLVEHENLILKIFAKPCPSQYVQTAKKTTSGGLLYSSSTGAPL